MGLWSLPPRGQLDNYLLRVTELSYDLTQENAGNFLPDPKPARKYILALTDVSPKMNRLLGRGD